MGRRDRLALAEWNKLRQNNNSDCNSEGTKHNLASWWIESQQPGKNCQAHPPGRVEQAPKATRVIPQSNFDWRNLEGTDTTVARLGKSSQ
jgi:hypothetical protein